MAFVRLASRRRPAGVRPIKTGIVAGIRGNTKKKQSFLELRFNVDVMAQSRWLIGDRLEIYFDAEKKQLLLKRSPDGEIRLRPYIYGEKSGLGTANTSLLRLSFVPGLTNEPLPGHACDFFVDETNPAHVYIQLPEEFFATGKPFNHFIEAA